MALNDGSLGDRLTLTLCASIIEYYRQMWSRFGAKPTIGLIIRLKNATNNLTIIIVPAGHIVSLTLPYMIYQNPFNWTAQCHTRPYRILFAKCYSKILVMRFDPRMTQKTQQICKTWNTSHVQWRRKRIKPMYVNIITAFFLFFFENRSQKSD